LDVQKQKMFQLDPTGALPPDPRYRLALCALAMPLLCQILNTPLAATFVTVYYTVSQN